MSTLFALLAGIFAVGQILPYTISSIRGETKPSRVAAAISVTSNVVIVTSMFAEGAHAGLVLPIAFTFTGLITFVLAIKYGKMRVTKTDWINAAIAASALAAYLLLGPEAALIAMPLAQGTACMTVFNKLRHHPGSENRLAWVMTFLAPVFSVAAILAEGSVNPEVLFAPAVSLVAFGAILVLTFAQYHAAHHTIQHHITSAFASAKLASRTLGGPAALIEREHELALTA